MDICRKASGIWGNSFTYTLIESKDIASKYLKYKWEWVDRHPRTGLVRLVQRIIDWFHYILLFFKVNI